MKFDVEILLQKIYVIMKALRKIKSPKFLISTSLSKLPYIYIYSIVRKIIA